LGLRHYAESYVRLIITAREVAYGPTARAIETTGLLIGGLMLLKRADARLTSCTLDSMRPHIFADAELARLLETHAALELERLFSVTLRRFPGNQAQVQRVGGGVVAWFGPAWTFNGAVGMGLTGPVAERDVDEVEAFFRSHGEPARITVCPFSARSLVDELGKRGYRIADLENELVREIGPGTPPVPPADAPGPDGRAPDQSIEIREHVTPDARSEWGRAVAVGFRAPDAVPDSEWSIGEVVAGREGVRLFSAWLDGGLVGTGELDVVGGMAWLNADTTLPDYRGRGVQTALLRHRLRLAEEVGCVLAVSETVPGSGSQRNMERHGMRVVYTRIDLLGHTG
jgi:GNAT superfamily N-acetyltransferase